MENKALLILAVLGILLEITFGSLPFWPPINEEIENLLNTNEYTFHDRQFYYTFIILGAFANVLAIISVVKNNHFLYINVIWLGSFVAASFLIKLVWELIFILMQSLQADESEIKTSFWPILVKYLIGVIFYGLLVFLSNRARLAIILHTLAFHKNPISRADIEMLYEKLSTINPDPNIQRALLENKAHMNSLIASIEHAKVAQTSGSSAQGQTIESNGANSAAGWHKTNSFMGKSFNRQNTGVIEEASHTGSSNGQMTFQTNRSETTSLMNPSDNK